MAVDAITRFTPEAAPVDLDCDDTFLGARFWFHTARQLLYHVPVTRAVGPLATSRQMPQRL